MDLDHDHIRVLSDLSGDVVGTLLDEDAARPSESDPFAAALRRYQEDGQPIELTGSWRRSITPSPVMASDHAAQVLRLLARDLLACVTASRADVAATSEEPGVEAPPANVRPIGGAIVTALSFELASDGTWRPATSAAGTKEQLESGHRPAYVPTLGSRYPDASGRQGTHTRLPPAPPSAAFTLPPVPPAAPPGPATPRAPDPVAPRPPFAVTPVAPVPPMPAPTVTPSATPPPVATSAESVIQAVSGGTELIAGPFDRFQQLAAFVKALRALQGVRDVTTRQFVRGMVHLRVRYTDAIALATRLEGMAEFAPEIVSSSPTRIEIRVSPPDDVPPARG